MIHRLPRLLVLLAALPAAACQHGGGAALPQAVPAISVRSNPNNAPGYVSPCAGGQPQMQYNCPRFSN